MPRRPCGGSSEGLFANDSLSLEAYDFAGLTQRGGSIYTNSVSILFRIDFTPFGVARRSGKSVTLPDNRSFVLTRLGLAGWIGWLARQ